MKLLKIAFIPILILLLSSCSQKNKYSIKGELSSDTSEEWIYMQRLTFDDVLIIDSAKIVDKKFSFEGNIQKAQLNILSFHWSRSTGIKIFLLEPYDYDVKIDMDNFDYSEVNGGKYNEEINRINALYLQPIRDLPSNTPESKIDSLVKIGQEARSQYIETHPRSPTSVVFLVDKMPSLSAEKMGKHLHNLSSLDYMTIYQSMQKMGEIQSQIMGQESEGLIEMSMTDINYETISLLDNSVIKRLVKKHPNKTLYIDCWSLSCAPCLKEFSPAAKLKNDLKDESIEFIYVCMGINQESDIEKWTTTVNKHDVQGSHYIMSNDQAKIFYQELGSKIQLTPYYSIVNKEGNVAYSNAPRPSDKKTKQLLINTDKRE